jgi:hypothetical protein
MYVTRKLLLGTFFTLPLALPLQAQPGGDYYAPGPTTVVHGTPDQLKRSEQGDYYVGDTMVLNKRRMEALKKCTEGTAFDSDRYVACMAREGEAP